MERMKTIKTEYTMQNLSNAHLSSNSKTKRRVQDSIIASLIQIAQLVRKIFPSTTLLSIQQRDNCKFVAWCFALFSGEEVRCAPAYPEMECRAEIDWGRISMRFFRPISLRH